MAKNKFTRYLFGTEQNREYLEGIEHFKKLLKTSGEKPEIFSFEEGVTSSFKFAEAMHGWDEFGVIPEEEYQILVGDNNKIILDKLLKVDGVWDFVATYYGGYSSADDIAWNDDLTKVVEGEINGGAIDTYIEYAERIGITIHKKTSEDGEDEDFDFDYSDYVSEVQHSKIVNEVKKALLESNADIYERTIQNFLEEIEPLKIK